MFLQTRSTFPFFEKSFSDAFPSKDKASTIRYAIVFSYRADDVAFYARIRHQADWGS